MSSPSYLNTAQNVNLEYRLANIGSRLGAYILDWLIKIAYIILLFVLLDAVGGLNSWLPALFLLPIMFYTLIFEIINEGQTPGKRSVDIKVVSKDGAPVSIGQYILRWLMRIVDFHLMSGIIALISIGASTRNQRIGDIVAGTLVVSTKQFDKLEHTAYKSISENYIPTYPTAINLSNQDIRTLKEVLANKSENSFSLVTEAAQRVETILDVKKSGSSRSFLNIVIDDYNYYQNVEM